MATGFQDPFVRHTASYIVITFFLIFMLVMGLVDERGNVPGPLISFGGAETDSTINFPDFSRVIHTRTLTDSQLNFGTPNRRVIAVGDIHGKKDSFDELLDKLQYSSSSDLLMHTGDIIAKSPLKDSLAVLSYMTSNNVTGVRGNHDQAVIEWRGWIDRVLAMNGGRQWLEELEKFSASDLKEELKVLQGKKKGKKGEVLAEWKRIPKKWEFMDDHYHIAREMTQAQYAYLLSLPLVLHIPYLHTFLVHAGLLPLDPRRSVTSQRQPLSHIPHPTLSSNTDSAASIDAAFKSRNISALRTAQERSMLSDVPQNTDTWSVLNMRGIKSDNSVTKSTSKGEPWSDLWNSIIDRCDGYEDFWSLSDVDMLKAKKLPCYPSTIVYGHAASRNLDIKRWSKGLDTGCVYKRKLTALVLTPKSSNLSEFQASSSKVKFGGEGLANAHLVDVKC
ncbi:Metallo-dependent phosphatase [Schizopora paradoxa]|uniref:Metallo-dependent phosphatase n=1 Tax=Schizopora paradoxa TaxID=27342 RepID=A0A0H2RTC4_9AGAM|nr:Metallo-dependent phosphatase [Schizopora paradoxa]